MGILLCRQKLATTQRCLGMLLYQLLKMEVQFHIRSMESTVGCRRVVFSSISKYGTALLRHRTSGICGAVFVVVLELATTRCGLRRIVLFGRRSGACERRSSF